MPYKIFYSTFNSGSYRIQWSVTVLANFGTGHFEEQFCEIILKCTARENVSFKGLFLF